MFDGLFSLHTMHIAFLVAVLFVIGPPIISAAIGILWAFGKMATEGEWKGRQ
jgi:hypothetical protein